MLLISNTKYCSKPKPALFLDRDGVINEDYGYVYRKKNFKFKSGIFELVRAANLEDYFCVIVTNQAGIGRGLYSINDLRVLSNWMCEKFKAKDCNIDAIYFSPFHPTEGKGIYLRTEETRKPGAGMFNEAVKDLNIDLSKSVLVGDKISDIEAGLAAGISHNYLLCSNHLAELTQVRDKKISKVFDIPSVTTHFSRQAGL